MGLEGDVEGDVAFHRTVGPTVKNQEKVASVGWVEGLEFTAWN